MTAFRDAARPALHETGGKVALTLTDEISGATATKSVDFRSAGVDDVRMLSSSAIRTRFPAPESVDIETVAAPYVEFTSPDLPWRYTARGEVAPWLVLIAAAPEDLSRSDEGSTMRLAESARATPGGADLLDAAALWAHVVYEDDAEAERANEGFGRARLIDPRPMPPGVERFACLCVRPAGPVPRGDVVLRVLDYWRFRTNAEAGDARVLARQLRVLDIGDDPRVATATVRYPMPDGAEDALLPMSGVLIPASRASDPPVPPDVAADVADGLTPPQGADGRVALGSPDYGARYAPSTEAWRAGLNADPRLRAAASLGVEAARHLEDALMVAVRTQLGALTQVRRLVASAQFGETLDTVWRRRRFTAAGVDGAQLATRGAFARHVRVGAGGPSLEVALAETALPADALHPAAIAALRGQGLAVDPLLKAFGAPRPVRQIETGGDGGLAMAAIWAAALDRMGADASVRFDVTDRAGVRVPVARFESLLTADPGVRPGDLLAWVAALESRERAALAAHAATEAAQRGRGDGDAAVWIALSSGFATPAGVVAGLDDPGRAVERLLSSHSARDGMLLAASGDPLAGLRRAEADMRAAGDTGAAGLLDEVARVAAGQPFSDSAGPALVWAAILASGERLFRGVADVLARRTPTLRLRDAPRPPPGGTPPPDPPQRPVDLDMLSDRIEMALDGAGRRAAETQLGEPLPNGPLRAPLGFDTPGWAYLRDHAPDWLLPGRSLIADHTVAAMRTNATFIDAFMVGFNEGALSELAWRGIDVDRTVTPCRNFWDLDTEEGWTPDIAPILAWGDTPLGHPTHRRGHGGNEPVPTDYLVMLLKTPLLRRYPALEMRLEIPDGADWHPIHPAIQGALDPDTHFVGFDLALADAQDSRLVLEQSRADGGYRTLEPGDGVGAGARSSDVAATLWRLRLRIVMDLSRYLGAQP